MLNTVIPIFSAGVAAGGDFESIATVTVGSGGASSVEFTSIPGTYAHLQIRIFATNTSGSFDDTKWNFNNDTTTANYAAIHQLRGDGATASAYADVSVGYLLPFPTGASTTRFSAGVIDILDYANSNKFKTVRSLNGHDLNGSGNIYLRSGLWMSTSAINKIVIATTANLFADKSHFALYGIKSA